MSATIVHVGEPDDNWRPVEEGRALIHIHNFADLPQEKGTALKSPTFTCAGHEWFLWLYPQGHSAAPEGIISVYLGSDLTSNIVVDINIIMKNKTGETFRYCYDEKDEFPRPKNNGWGLRASRVAILDASNNVLNNGTLTFEVRIRPHEDFICRDVTPKYSVADDLYNVYQDEDNADVAFKLDANVFYAHKAILKARVPELAELVEKYDTEKTFSIEDVEPEVFEIMLKNVYGKEIGGNYWEDHAKQILDASGKYGFAKLKSAAEAFHVKNLKQNFTVENVVDELLYADGKSCPLLKKAAMDFILEHSEEVVESESYAKLDESPQLRKEMMYEVTKALASHKKRKRDE
ncbi:hypothetical protein ACHAWO_011057 [Cyclotella atomus]|uniref:BTB domain-containing protein n=1 Tax=Cyclotella atomus TaxID=382360 RepID=A0ABD3QWZ9_9STRA